DAAIGWRQRTRADPGRRRGVDCPLRASYTLFHGRQTPADVCERLLRLWGLMWSTAPHDDSRRETGTHNPPQRPSAQMCRQHIPPPCAITVNSGATVWHSLAFHQKGIQAKNSLLSSRECTALTPAESAILSDSVAFTCPQ